MVLTRDQEKVSFESLYNQVSNFFDTQPDHRRSNASHRLSDILRSAFGMFSLKSPSLLAFEKRSRQEAKNLLNIFRIQRIPSDSQMRYVLDEVNPSLLRPGFRRFFDVLLDTGVVKEYEYFKGAALVSIDGVEHFCSKKVHCDYCTRKEHKNGQTTYHHAMLAAVMVHPEQSEVFPLDCEAIVCQDGSSKNDCERNAAKRLVEALSKAYPDTKLVVVEDALYANGPHIRQISAHDWHYIINVKPKSHKSLFKQFEGRSSRGQTRQFQVQAEKGVTHRFEYTNNLALNDSSGDVRVNFLRYQQQTASGKTNTFCWVTDMQLTTRTVSRIMRAARSRWKIENETFNTLKNQGYHFEHNYGHGHKYLSTVLALLMFLAFSLDQIQQHCSKPFRKLWKGLGTKVKLWECLRSFFKSIVFRSMQALFGKIAASYCIQLE